MPGVAVTKARSVKEPKAVKAQVATKVKGKSDARPKDARAPQSKPRLPKAAKKGEPVLLSGGNPQIAKGDGDGPVQAFIAAVPGWKQEVARRLDELIVQTVPNVQKAVKWNSPFYGVEGQGWFLSYHCMTKYIKVGFFKGASLNPVPPVESKDATMRYYHVHENEEIDEKQFTAWVKQASKIPGWMA